MADTHDTAACFSTLGRINSVITGFESGRNANGDMVRNIAVSLIYTARDALTAQAAEIARLTGELCEQGDLVAANNREAVEQRQRAEKAEAALAAAEARLAVLEEAIREVERLYYMEGRDLTWRAAHMRSVAADALNQPSAETAWRHPTAYPEGDELVHVLCQVTPPEIGDFPRACELPVSSGDHAVGDMFVSIGWRDDEGEWFVAGWEMTQDCWTNARCFAVKGWKPMPAALARGAA